MKVYGLNKHLLKAGLFSVIATCAIATTVTLSSLNFAHAGSYEDGVNAYKLKRYDKAIQFFQADLKGNPSNAQSVFYLGMTCAKSGKLSEARQAFEMVTKMLPANDPVALKAKNNIEIMTKAQVTLTSGSAKADQISKISSSKYKSNYLSHAIPDGSVIRFDETKMPLKVFINNPYNVPGYRTEMRNAINDAFTAWRTASGGKVRFEPTSKRENADIVVSWNSRFNDNKLGVSPFQVMGGKIIQSDVTLGTTMPDGSPMPYSVFRGTTIHEFGHAIGIKGHSPYPEDIMYFSTNGNQSSNLTSRDKNTINWLYKVEADVKNSADMSVSQTKTYYEYFRKGLEAQKTGNDTLAIGYYQKAVKMSDSQWEAKYNLAVILYNRGVGRLKQQDFQNAKTDFITSENLLVQVLGTGEGPKETEQLLSNARQNKTFVTQKLSQAF